MTCGSIAFADESVRVNADPPMYSIAATIMSEDADMGALECLLPKGAKKLHWRDIGPKVQKNALASIAELGTRSTIVVASPIVPQKQERARRKDLEVLLPLLESEKVDLLVMESRFPAADAKDKALFRSLQKKGLVDSIKLRFANPEHEHRLWIPDQILGAFSDSSEGLRSAEIWRQEWSDLCESVTIVRIEL